VTAQPPEQVGADGVVHVVPAELKAVHDGERDGRILDFSHCDGPVQRDHRARRDDHELVVQLQDLTPVGSGRHRRVAVHGADRRLDLVRAGSVTPQASADEVLPFGDEGAVPAGPVLVGQRHQGTVLAGPRGPA